MTAFDFIREKLKAEKEEKKSAYEYALDSKLYGIADVLMGKVSEVDEVLKIIDESEKEFNDGWIPCGERLPENDDEVLCWYECRVLNGTHAGDS